MPKTKITFKTTKKGGIKFGALKVQKFSLPGHPPLPILNITLTNGKGSKDLDSGSTYTLRYGYFGEPGGTFQIVIVDPNGTVLLDKVDTMPDDQLADSGDFAFATP